MVRRPEGHTFFTWPTSDCLGTQGPLDFALFLLKAPLGHQGSRSRATLKKCALGASYRAYRPPQEGLAAAKAKSASSKPVPT